MKGPHGAWTWAWVSTVVAVLLVATLGGVVVSVPLSSATDRPTVPGVRPFYSGPTIVDNVSTGSAGTVNSVTEPLRVVAGDTIYVALIGSSGSQLTATVTDTQSNSYSDTGTAYVIYGFNGDAIFVFVATASATGVDHITGSDSGTQIAWMAFDIHGANGIQTAATDAVVNSLGSNLNSQTATAQAPLATDSLVMDMVGAAVSPAATFTSGGPTGADLYNATSAFAASSELNGLSYEGLSGQSPALTMDSSPASPLVSLLVVFNAPPAPPPCTYPTESENFISISSHTTDGPSSVGAIGAGGPTNGENVLYAEALYNGTSLSGVSVTGGSLTGGYSLKTVVQGTIPASSNASGPYDAIYAVFAFVITSVSGIPSMTVSTSPATNVNWSITGFSFSNVSDVIAGPLSGFADTNHTTSFVDNSVCGLVADFAFTRSIVGDIPTGWTYGTGGSQTAPYLAGPATFNLAAAYGEEASGPFSGTFGWNTTVNSPYGSSLLVSIEANTVTAHVPPSPTGLTATAVSSSQINLAWTNAVGPLTDVLINAWNNSPTCYAPAPSQYDLLGVFSAYAVTGLTQSSTDSFEVIDVNATGIGFPSACATATTFGQPPKAPTNLAVTATTDTSVSLSWKNPPGPLVNITVYVSSLAACGTPRTGHSVGSAGAVYTVGGLLAQTTYYFTVTAWNSTGQSANSTCVAGTTLSTIVISSGSAGSFIEWVLVTLMGILFTFLFLMVVGKRFKFWEE